MALHFVKVDVKTNLIRLLCLPKYRKYTKPWKLVKNNAKATIQMSTFLQITQLQHPWGAG